MAYLGENGLSKLWIRMKSYINSRIGEVGSVAVENIVPIEKGGTNAATIETARQNISFIGQNPITTVEADTPPFWMSQGTGLARFDNNAQIIDKPTTYGLLLNITARTNVNQFWFESNGGNVYQRGGHETLGWGGTWKKIKDATNGSAITVMNNTAVTLQTSASKIALDSSVTRIGDKFSNVNGGVRSNQSGTIEVSGSLFVGSGLSSGDYIYVQIYKNGTNVMTATAGKTHTNVKELSVTPVVLGVAEGDTIYMYAYNTTGARGAVSVGPGTRLTVKEV